MSQSLGSASFCASAIEGHLHFWCVTSGSSKPRFKARHLDASPSGAGGHCSSGSEAFLCLRCIVEAVANSKIGGHKFRGISGGERRRAAVGVGDLLAKLIPASTLLC